MTGRRHIETNALPTRPTIEALKCESMMSSCHGKPTLFITITCNPKWPEITAALLPGQRPKDRPDLVALVFHVKLSRIIKDLTKDGVFGKASAFLRVIEFQKRGELIQNYHFALQFNIDEVIQRHYLYRSFTSYKKVCSFSDIGHFQHATENAVIFSRSLFR